jgi:hypothetical protein
MAYDQPSGYTLGKGVVIKLVEDGGREELAGTTTGGVPGQVLVHLIAQRAAGCSARLGSGRLPGFTSG